MTISLKNIVSCLVPLTLLLCIAGCTQYDVTEVLLSRNDISLTMKGNTIFVYDPDCCQVAYNTDKNQYWSMKDDESEYFILQAHQSLSSLGQEFTADLRYTESGKEKSEKDLTFRIEKISNSEGLVWLWCSSDNIGLLIRVF